MSLAATGAQVLQVGPMTAKEPHQMTWYCIQSCRLHKSQQGDHIALAPSRQEEPHPSDPILPHLPPLSPLDRQHQKKRNKVHEPLHAKPVPRASDRRCMAIVGNVTQGGRCNTPLKGIRAK
jgi:hypothetical protein